MESSRKELKQTVFFVDDEPLLTEALQAKLEARGFRCIVRTNMSSALGFLEEENVGVIVTDIMMPAGQDFADVDSSETGFVFVEQVKKRFPAVAIVCLSVIGDQRKIRELKRKNVLYLRKGETPLETAVKLIVSKATGTFSM